MKLIYTLMGASVLMIVLGIYLILQEQQVSEQGMPAGSEMPAQRDSNRGADQNTNQNIGVIPALQERERDSETPQIEVDAEPGSEQWCEQMMVLADDKWTREDSQTFADECIYDD